MRTYCMQDGLLLTIPILPNVDHQVYCAIGTYVNTLKTLVANYASKKWRKIGFSSGGGARQYSQCWFLIAVRILGKRTTSAGVLRVPRFGRLRTTNILQNYPFGHPF